MSLLILFLSSYLLACDGGYKGKIITIDPSVINKITQKEFENAAENFEKFFNLLTEDEFDQEVIVFKSWKSSTVNAFAERQGKRLMITIYGGLARHPVMSKDSLDLVLCHELGHHLGGFPKKLRPSWSSAEGQADYYSTTKCLRRYWEGQDHLSFIQGKILPDEVKSQCENAYKDSNDQHLCYRLSLASKEMALLFQALDYDSIEPKFDTPDPLVVNSTQTEHQFSQCRLDTYFQGALCQKSFWDEFDIDDEAKGACHSRWNDKSGTRPLCWFKPRG